MFCVIKTPQHKDQPQVISGMVCTVMNCVFLPLGSYKLRKMAFHFTKSNPTAATRSSHTLVAGTVPGDQSWELHAGTETAEGISCWTTSDALRECQFRKLTLG